MNEYTQQYAREVDWPRVLAGNTGPYVCWQDARFPGGYFVSRREPPHVFFCGTRDTMEALAANIIATIGYLPLVCSTPADIALTTKALHLARTLLAREIRRGISDHLPVLSYGQALFGLWNRIMVHPRAPAVLFQTPLTSVPVSAQEYLTLVSKQGQHLNVQA